LFKFLKFMSKNEKKTIKEICLEIDLIIEDKADKVDYKYNGFNLNNALKGTLTTEDSELICTTVIKIAKTKNRILRHLEKGYWAFIDQIPFALILSEELVINDNEELLPNTAYKQHNKKILSQFLGLAYEILALKDDNSKGSDLRRSGSVKLIVELLDYYHIPGVKDLLLNSINSKNENEQFNALEGLESYFSIYDDEIEAEFVQNLNSIHNNTEDRTIAYLCLQIQVTTGAMDEGTALFKLDDWKDAHYDQYKHPDED